MLNTFADSKGSSFMTKAKTRCTNGAARRRVLAWLRSQQSPCWICRLSIDYSLGGGHRWGMVGDELIPFSLGGSPYTRDNVAPAHWCCNSWRGAKSVEYVRALQYLVFDVYHYHPRTPDEFIALCKMLEKQQMDGQKSKVNQIKSSTEW